MNSPIWRCIFGYNALFLLALGRYLSPVLGLTPLFARYIARRVRNTGLFDSEYYSLCFPELSGNRNACLMHYVNCGDEQGQRPSFLFDPDYYRAEASHLPCISTCNSVLHYALVGRHLGKSPSSHFDANYYLAQNPDVASSGIDPFLHFIRFGGKEGRNPSRVFNSSQYLNEHPEVARRNGNPLIHSLTDGDTAGSAANSRNAAPRHTSELPPHTEWHKIFPNIRQAEHAQVDIIVPVYKDKELTLRCIFSVLNSKQSATYELIVINDASPDVDLVGCLRDLKRDGLITLLENESNQGYVYSANLGMMLHHDRDVVQLNADAEVFNDWLDRIRNCAYQNDRTGTVTPLSNNATICSYPSFNRDNPEPLELGYEELDLLASSVNKGKTVETPTGVGFCMYIRRECINEIGFYNQAAFGRGYGEENDFCQRAQQKKWGNLICCDVFVLHHGSASFQGDRVALIAHAMQMINELHPNYHKDVAQFVRRDAIAPYRQRLDEARLDRCSRETNVLMLAHNLGGGTERFVNEEISRQRKQGAGVFLMRPFLESSFVISTPAIKNLNNIPPFELADRVRVFAMVKNLKITELQFHHMVGMNLDILELVRDLVKSCGLDLKIYIHDYLSICPRVNLVDGSGRYCGEPSTQQCKYCLETNGSSFGKVDIVAWREAFHALFFVASEIVVPDVDVSTRLKKYFCDLHFNVVPHEPSLDFALSKAVSTQSGNDTLRIVVIGAISQIKGFDVLLACAKDAKERSLPLAFSVLGYTSNDEKAREAGIQVTGRYSEAEGMARLVEIRPHAVFLPSILPETYCFTLSLALKAGLPVFAFDLGAIASRLKSLGLDQNLTNIENASNITALNDWLIEKCRATAS